MLFVLIVPAILFPVFAQAREKARAVSCMSNEKQQGLAILMYSQDYDEMLPPSAQWMGTIQPYVKNDAVFKCPDVTHGEIQRPDYGYAFNSNLSRRSMDDALRPEITVMEFESSMLFRSATDAFTSFPNPGRHTLRDNIGFMDGHVKMMSLEQIGDVQKTMKSAKLFGKPSKPSKQGKKD
jgi:prepilin-type processing-associated H-X9-DG protein